MKQRISSSGPTCSIRRICRWSILGVAVAIGWPFGSGWASPFVLPSLSPWITAISSITVRTVGLTALMALPVLILSLMGHRWFCHYACPMGLLLESTERIQTKGHHRRSHSPVIGRGLVVLTVGSALVGYPIFLWLDPLAIFNSFLNAWRQPIAWAVLLTGMGLPMLLLINIIAPRVWCRSVCPLGVAQDFLFAARCFLTNKSLHRKPNHAAGLSDLPLGRRGILTMFAGLAGGFAIKTHRPVSPPLRPPGSIEEDAFTAVCVRCGNCSRVCPSNIMQPDFGVGGIQGLLTPRLWFDEDYCRQDCHRCTVVCPSGAIGRLSLEDKRRWIIGYAVVNTERCLLANGRECTACIRQCPYQAIMMLSTDGGFSNAPAVDLNRCNGCGACQASCPVLPVRAIIVQLS